MVGPFLQVINLLQEQHIGPHLGQRASELGARIDTWLIRLKMLDIPADNAHPRRLASPNRPIGAVQMEIFTEKDFQEMVKECYVFFLESWSGIPFGGISAQLSNLLAEIQAKLPQLGI